MRETLYFKDDDSRLSFLQGNFITLTNMSEDEIERIIKYKLSPINISVHTTNPELRIKMLNNKNAGNVYEILKRFHKAKLKVNCQIVLVPFVNDGAELLRTINDLSKLYPTIESVAVVPVGITRYREGLFDVTPYDKKLSDELLDIAESLQRELLGKIGTRFIFPSDEFYCLSKREVPLYKEYEGFPQLENGVGLMKSFEHEIDAELAKIKTQMCTNKKYILATGTLAYDFISKLASKIEEKFKDLSLQVIPIVNHFFGETITVAGLITGEDLVGQLKEHTCDLDGIIIPKSMLKRDEDVFLDDLLLHEAEEKLGAKIIVSNVEGKALLKIFEEEVNK